MTRSTFAYALAACGFDNEHAATFFGVSVDSIKSWKNGRRNVPDAIWASLAQLHEQIQFNAGILAQRMTTGGPSKETVGKEDMKVHGSPLPEQAEQMALALAYLAASTSASAGGA